jgi:N-formylglutamate deformylase
MSIATQVTRADRHSLQVEINKRLYMDEVNVQPHAGFEPLQRNVMRLIDAIVDRFSAGARP